MALCTYLFGSSSTPFGSTGKGQCLDIAAVYSFWIGA